MTITGKLTTTTRRDFIRGVAAAGASTAGAVALGGAGADLFAEEARAHGGPGRFGRFTAIAPSSEDAFQVPPGYRADVVIAWGDVFRAGNGRALRYGFNNDFLAYFPLKGSREGLLFVNHEYPDTFFLHGYKPDGSAKTAAQVQEEQDSVGNSIVHVRRRLNGAWTVVTPSPYNRRIYGDRPDLQFTGPLAGAAGIGASAHGSVANCSGGITPWGTALSCEENFDGYGTNVARDLDFGYGWHQFGGQPEDAEYHPTNFKKYGWVCEHDPYDPGSVGRKHTALGRFRHENTAFRHEPGSRFVLYMGDDKANEGVYKFVSERRFNPGQKESNRRLLEAGQLYIARWEPEGRRRFAAVGDTEPITPTEGTGRWVPVPEEALDDTATKLRAAFGDEYDVHFATNRPEDVEVAEDGTVYIALTNNSSVRDSHGSVRRLREKRNDPEALEFSWRDYAAGGPTGSGQTGAEGFSSPDNLVFDKAGNLWVVTDISSRPAERRQRVRLPREQRLVPGPYLGPEQRRRLPLRQRTRAVRADRALLHPRREHAVRERAPPGRADREQLHGARGVRPGGDLRELVARGQPHGGGQPLDAEAGDRGDHSEVRTVGAGLPAAIRFSIASARLRNITTLRSLISS